MKEFIYISNIIESKKDINHKIQSSIIHEIFNNLLIEGYVSSRKMIKDIVNKKAIPNPDKIIQNISSAITYISQGRKINKDNILYLYTTLTNDITMGQEQLDGRYY